MSRTRNQRASLTCLTLTLLGLVVAGSLPASAANEGTVNVNTASAEELALLPRVGETVAQRIIDFRETNGSFKKAEELMLVRGIGERVFEQIRPYVTLAGETTLEEKVRTARPAASAESADSGDGA